MPRSSGLDAAAVQAVQQAVQQAVHHAAASRALVLLLTRPLPRPAGAQYRSPTPAGHKEEALRLASEVKHEERERKSACWLAAPELKQWGCAR